MQKELTEHLEMRKYLLGQIDLDTSGERIEQRLMLDETYYEDLLSVEEELIQEYVDGELAPAEKSAFEKYFLISDERRERVDFARVFREFIDKQDIDEPQIIPAEEKPRWVDFITFSPRFRFPLAVAMAGLVLVSAFFGWKFYANYSEDRKTIALLNNAFKNQRPLESRITKLSYAPYPRLRGEQKADVNETDLRRAEVTIENRVANDPTAHNLHLLGKLDIARKQFYAAIALLEKAKGLAPGDAQVLNDLGVAKFERSQLELDDNARPQLAKNALADFDQAIVKDPRLLEAKFNRARSLETLNMNMEATEAWREYLKLETDPDWIKEAQLYLQQLEKKIPK